MFDLLRLTISDSRRRTFFELLTRYEYAQRIRKSTSVTDINQINRDFVSRKCKQRDAFYARYAANRNRGLHISDNYTRRNSFSRVQISTRSTDLDISIIQAP